MDDHSEEERRGMKPEIESKVEAKSLNQSTTEEEELFDAVNLLLSLGNGDSGPQPRKDLGGKVDEDEVVTSDSLIPVEIDEINLLLELKNKKNHSPGKNLTIFEKGNLDSNNFKMIDEQSSNAKNQFKKNKVIEMTATLKSFDLINVGFVTRNFPSIRFKVVIRGSFRLVQWPMKFSKFRLQMKIQIPSIKFFERLRDIHLPSIREVKNDVGDCNLGAKFKLGYPQNGYF